MDGANCSGREADRCLSAAVCGMVREPRPGPLASCDGSLIWFRHPPFPGRHPSVGLTPFPLSFFMRSEGVLCVPTACLTH